MTMQTVTTKFANYNKGVSKLFTRDIFLRDFYLCVDDEEIDKINSMIDWYFVGKDIENAIDKYKISIEKIKVNRG